MKKEIQLESSLKMGPIGKLTTSDGAPIEFEHVEIFNDGTILAITSGLPLFIKLKPIIRNGKVVDWKCSGKPKKLFLLMCS